ncbi:MAG: hypothetical protein GYB68_01775 [Chloroflexi bacterium]|nr:hypothetical protein [Chloroflexota bacterium]
MGGKTQTKANRVANMISKIARTQEHELDCEECYEHLDHYAEMLQNGEDPSAVLPQVKEHLEMCSCCTEELGALISVLEGQAEAQS